MYCAHCGNPLPDEVKAEDRLEETEVVASADVQIAKINAERDIALAKIQAKIAESELVTENAALEAENDVLQDVVSPEPEIEQEPVIVINDAPQEPEPADATELPEAEDHSEPAERKSSRVGLGMW
jgi:regulator of replication initiation timing